MKTFTHKKQLFNFLFVILIVLSMMVPAYAETTMSSEQAKSALAQKTYTSTSTKTYERDGGGSMKGSQLFKKEQGTRGSGAKYVVDADKFKELSSNGQNQFAKDIGDTVTNSYRGTKETGRVPGVNKDTADSYLRELTKTPGLGTKMLVTLTNGLQPDFVSAQRFVRPFEGPLNTIVGIISFVIFMGLFLSVALDCAYCALPFFQGAVASAGGAGGAGMPMGAGGGGRTKKAAFNIISGDAKRAVEESDQISSKALINLLKHRFMAILALAFVMFYLVMGQAMALVGLILDLFHGLVF